MATMLSIVLRSEEHTSELQSLRHLVCRLLLEKKKDQVQFGWYAQDDWRIRKSLTLSFGGRHELQTNLNDRNNLMPRAGCAWSDFKKGNTTLRCRGGRFCDWFGAETYDQALRVNGQLQSDLDISNPGFPNPSSRVNARTLPASLFLI